MELLLKLSSMQVLNDIMNAAKNSLCPAASDERQAFGKLDFNRTKSATMSTTSCGGKRVFLKDA